METFNEKTRAILEEIVVQIQSYVDSSEYKLLFYVEAEENWNSRSLYAQVNDQITWIRTDNELSELVMDLFYSAPEDRRWTAFSLVIEGDTFDVNFYFSDDLPPGDELEGRTRTIFEAHFGDRPVTYPPFP
jgi:hypothetical protein